MTDRSKVFILVVACLGIIFSFIGQGLTLDNYQFFLSRRAPKILAIILAAIAISSSSLVFQTITNNQILTPSILGFDSLYLLIQVSLLVIFGSASFIILNSLVNFTLSVALMIMLSIFLFHFYFKRQNQNIFTLLLIGVVCASIFNSITGFLTMLVDPSEFSIIQDSMFASFNNIKSHLVYWSILPLLICLYMLFHYAKQLDVMWLGADNATSLGVDCQTLTKKIMVIVTIMIAISTALVGPVLFFGLITVSLTRQLFNKFQHTFLISASTLLAVFLLVTGQYIVEKVLNFETTISVIINFVGGSYFIFLLLTNRIR